MVSQMNDVTHLNQKKTECTHQVIIEKDSNKHRNVSSEPMFGIKSQQNHLSARKLSGNKTALKVVSDPLTPYWSGPTSIPIYSIIDQFLQESTQSSWSWSSGLFHCLLLVLVSWYSTLIGSSFSLLDQVFLFWQKYSFPFFLCFIFMIVQWSKQIKVSEYDCAAVKMVPTPPRELYEYSCEKLSHCSAIQVKIACVYPKD